MKPTIEVTGLVSELFCQRPTFSAGRFIVNHSPKRFSLKGFVRSGQNVTLVGNWVESEKWGKQFEAIDVAYRLPVDAKGLRHWLEWEVQSVGAVTANKLVDEFGPDLPRLCGEDPGQVAATCGVELFVPNLIAGIWQKQSAVVAVKSKLAGIGLTQHLTELIVEKFKNTAIQIIEDNPYMLLGEVEGLGFKTVDEIAKKSGVTGNDPRRVAAAVQWAVRGGYYDDGCTAVAETFAFSKAEEMIGEDSGDVVAITMALIADGKVERYAGDDGFAWLAYPSAVRAERQIWSFLKNATGRYPLAERFEPADGFTIGDYLLDESQVAAVYAAQENLVSVVTGGAGSGKTLVARAIHRHFKDGGADVYLVAPTGKAARRLSEVIGEDAATIHRALGFSPDGTFQHNEDNPLPKGLYIVDEVSMVDSNLMASFIRGLPKGAAVVLIGDENQLPPVGPGAMLRDILAHRLTTVTRLEKCHRQAGTLKKNSSAILDGVVAITDDEGEPPAWVLHKSASTNEIVIAAVKKLYEAKLAEWGFDPIRDVQFMTAIHKGSLGTKYLNKYLQWLHQGKLGNELDKPDEADDRRATLFVGDKVIHTKNNYQLNVMNGTLGKVVRQAPFVVEYEDGRVEYPDDAKGQVELGYVLTPHKMQGSEVPCAVVLMPKAHGFMQTKNWMYTAVTRAKRMAVIVGDGTAITQAALKIGSNNRSTLLSVWATNPELIEGDAA